MSNVLHSHQYDHDSPHNQRVDECCRVRVNEETQEIIINETLVFRPSEILFHLDAAAYADVIANISDTEDRMASREVE